MSTDQIASLLPAELTAETLFGALFSPDAWDDPYPLYDELRARGGLECIDDNLWVATTHSAVTSILRDPTFSSDERNSTITAGEGYQDADPSVGDFMLFQDPPDHTRLRSLVVRAFSRGRVAEIEPLVQGVVDELVPAGTNRSIDLVGDVATPLAIRVISSLLGVPVADRDRFHTWGEALARSLDPEVLRTPEEDQAANEASVAFAEYFDRLITIRRSEPADDLLSALIAVEEDGDRLSFNELVGVCMLVLVAGFETTINLIGNGAVAMSHDVAAADRLSRDVSVSSTAVDEFLRFDSPVQMNIRVATVDSSIDTMAIPAGDTVFNLLGAANRDADVFGRPHELDLARSPNPHVSFGGGIHHCLGAALARAEARLVFERVFGEHRVHFDAEPVRRHTFTLRGYESVPLRLTPK